MTSSWSPLTATSKTSLATSNTERERPGLRCGSRFSGSLSGIKPSFSVARQHCRKVFLCTGRSITKHSKASNTSSPENKTRNFLCPPRATHTTWMSSCKGSKVSKSNQQWTDAVCPSCVWLLNKKSSSESHPEK